MTKKITKTHIVCPSCNNPDGTIDSHGIFKYLTTLPYDDRIDKSDNNDLKQELMEKFIKKD